MKTREIKRSKRLLSLLVLVVMIGTAAGDVIYVDTGGGGGGTSWSDAFGNLQDALAKPPSSGDQIWVVQGTYKPDEGVGPTPGDRAATFQLINGVAIYGGFLGNETSLEQRNWVINETILSGDIGDPNNSGNSYHVVNGRGTDATTIIDGFTITAGNADGPDPEYDEGGGMHIKQGGDPTVINCIFIDNHAIHMGGAIFGWNCSSAITNCSFIGNSAGNWGGAIWNQGGCNQKLTNCIFVGNNANVAGGGAIGNQSSSPEITNCSFFGNSANSTGGGIYGGPGITMKNCIFWGNSDSGGMDETAQISHPPEVISYSCIQGLNTYAGNNNIGDDPLFQDADGDDDVVGTEGDNLRLSTCSPCIDAADNSAVPAGVTTDLDGNPRFVDDPGISDTGNGTPPIVDMGAYESLLVSPNSDHVSSPSPADDDTCVDTSVVLSWLPGCNSLSYDVYFGIVPSALGLVATLPLGQESYDLGVLELCRTYYWRIDDVDGASGDVWSFTTSCPSCCVQPPKGMVAWWTFDEDVGSTIASDSGGRIRDEGTLLNGASFTLNGMVNGGLNLNTLGEPGVNRYVEVLSSSDLNFGTGDLSIDMWVNLAPAATNSGVRTIIDKRTSGTSVQGYTLWINNGVMGFHLADGVGSATCGSTASCMNFSSGVNIADGQWHFIAVTVDRDEPDGGIWYVNGDEVGDRFNPTFINQSLTNSAPLWIGRHVKWASAYLYGMLDEIELFNRVLDESEIKAIFEAGAAGKCKCEEPPVSYVDDVKWAQPPDINNNGCINGWDEVSIYDSGSAALWFPCWDNPRQCHGDIDGEMEGNPFIGYYYVGNNDLSTLTGSFGLSYGDPGYNPCADFNHDGTVNQDDSDIFNIWYKVKEEPKGPGVPADCTTAPAIKYPIIADDWICMDERPITDIHWWGSFKNWTEQTPPAGEMPNAFQIGIWTDVPNPDSNEPDAFSHPGELIWETIAECYTWSYAGCDVDPRGLDEMNSCFKFDKLLSQDKWFYQEDNEPDGTVYWLSIAAIYDANTPEHAWGWKTRPHYYNDDAVRITDVSIWPPSIDAVWASGEPIEYPVGTSWDMAFALTTHRKFIKKPYWPDIKGHPAVDLDGNGVVDFGDFVIMANYWLEMSQPWPTPDGG